MWYDQSEWLAQGADATGSASGLVLKGLSVARDVRHALSCSMGRTVGVPGDVAWISPLFYDAGDTEASPLSAHTALRMGVGFVGYLADHRYTTQTPAQSFPKRSPIGVAGMPWVPSEGWRAVGPSFGRHCAVVLGSAMWEMVRSYLLRLYCTGG